MNVGSFGALETHKFQVREVYYSNYVNSVSLGLVGKGVCHAPVDQMQEISDINIVLLKRICTTRYR